jgi:hypothetical protein
LGCSFDATTITFIVGIHGTQLHREWVIKQPELLAQS